MTEAKHFPFPLPISRGKALGTKLKREALPGVRGRELAVNCRRITPDLSEQKHPRRGRAGLKFFNRKKTWDRDFPAWADWSRTIKIRFLLPPIHNAERLGDVDISSYLIATSGIIQ